MGKKGKRVDPAKKAALAAKKEAKAEKAARKRVQKEATASRGEGEEEESGHAEVDDSTYLDALLEKYRQQDNAKPKSTVLEKLDGFPPPRANATFTVHEDSKNRSHAYLFGGEYYDGVQHIVLNQLLRYDLSKQEWKLVQTAGPCPPPRCAHSCIYYNHALYVFGGEQALGDHQYIHYRDLWKFHLKDLSWQEIKPNRTAGGTLPSSRSGRVCGVWKHFMIIFGGFHEGKDMQQWYNDVTVFNLQTEQWLPIPHSKLTTNRPEPRSACNAAVLGDDLVVHGGFSKFVMAKSATPNKNEEEDPSLPVQETVVYTDAWVLHLKPLLQEKPPVWERLLRSTNIQKQPITVAALTKQDYAKAKDPAGRAGTASCAYKDSSMLVFAGVLDREHHHHVMESVFFNNIFGLDVSKRKWFSLTPHKKQQEAPGKEEEAAPDKGDSGSDLGEDDEDQENNNEKAAWDLERLRSKMSAFKDAQGNIIYERIHVKEEEEEEEEKESEEEKQEDKSPKQNATVPPTLQEPSLAPPTEPLPRIHPNLILTGNTLTVYGGIVEVGDREVTLDDMWEIDLRKREKGWQCIFPGTMHEQVWRGVSAKDDEDSYYSAGKSSNADEQDNDEDDSQDEEEEEKEGDESKETELGQLTEQYNLQNTDTTPHAGEALADFYARTATYWNNQAANETTEQPTKKELKRLGFGLARTRFEELAPVLARLEALRLDSSSRRKSSHKKS